jgi:hypothetical protein
LSFETDESAKAAEKVAETIGSVLANKILREGFTTMKSFIDLINGLIEEQRENGLKFAASQDLVAFISFLKICIHPYVQAWNEIHKLEKKIAKLKERIEASKGKKKTEEPDQKGSDPKVGSNKKSEKPTQAPKTILKRNGPPITHKLPPKPTIEKVPSVISSSHTTGGVGSKSMEKPSVGKVLTASKASGGERSTDIPLPKSPQELNKLLKEAEEKGRKATIPSKPHVHFKDVNRHQTPIGPQIISPLCGHCHKLGHKEEDCFFNDQSPKFRGKPSLLSLRRRSEEARFGGGFARVENQRMRATNNAFFRGGRMQSGVACTQIHGPPMLPNVLKGVPEMIMIKVDGQTIYVPRHMVKDD